MHTHRTAALAAALLAALPLTAVAQTLDGRGKGLDALSESVVIDRLNADGLSVLLDRDLDVMKVEPAAREQFKAGAQLARLAAAGGLKPADRRALAERIAKAIDPTVSKSSDAAQLQQQAYQLTAGGVEPTVTELEYFGENPAAQAQLKPVVAAVRHMFTQAGVLATAQLDVLAKQINNANFAQMQPKLKAVGLVRRTATFNFNRAGYAMALSLPPTDPARATTAEQTAEYLKQFDTPQSGIQAGIRVLLGKLAIVKGDFAAAKRTLDSVANAAAGSVQPPPTAAEQNDARYFAAVADLYAGHLAEADAGLQSMGQWQQTTYLPKLEAPGQQQVRAADAMLNFRIASAQADAATDPAAKAKYNDQAVTVLSDLLSTQDNASLRDLVFDQLAGRLPPDADLAKLSPLALQAVQQLGFDEYNKKDGEPFDAAKLRRGVDASLELARRDGKPGVTHDQAVSALYFAAYALKYKLHDDPAAADAFMDFMERYPGESEKSTDALKQAGEIVYRLHDAAVARNAPDPAEAKRYDRFLPLAVNPPYNQKQIALDYADLLRNQGKYDEALKYYESVPPTDKRYAAAQFRTLLALYTALGDAAAKPASTEAAKSMATRLQTVAAGVDKAAAADAASAKTDADRQIALGQRAIARYDAAISARRDLADPAKSLECLDGFEDAIKGLDKAAGYGQSAQVQRVYAYMDLKQTDKAVGVLSDLMTSDPKAGEGLIFALVQQIDHDFDVAKGANDKPAMARAADNRAKVSGFLVTYAEKSKDPVVQAQLGSYRLYDADSKRQAAELADDPATRTANLNAALAQYQQLADPKAKLTGDSAAAAQLGIGLTQYDLGQYEAAVKSLSPVMTKIGQPFVEVNHVRSANGQYWETYYKQLRSIAEVAHAKGGDAKAQADLSKAKQRVGSFFVLYGEQTGGPGYHDEYVQLAKDLGVPVAAAGKK